MVKRALLIGSNYTATPQATLYGCINDIVNVRNVLVDAYGYLPANIVMLRDDDKNRLPTKINIMNNLTQIIKSSSPSDEIWIHYSGHGTQLRDANGDEAEGLDEAIVPCDFYTAGMISDDEIFNVISKATCRLLIFFDSCHSGTAVDLQYVANYNNGIIAKSVNGRKNIANPNIVMISGCRDAQTSADS